MTPCYGVRVSVRDLSDGDLWIGVRVRVRQFSTFPLKVLLPTTKITTTMDFLYYIYVGTSRVTKYATKLAEICRHSPPPHNGIQTTRCAWMLARKHSSVRQNFICCHCYNCYCFVTHWLTYHLQCYLPTYSPRSSTGESVPGNGRTIARKHTKLQNTPLPPPLPPLPT